MSSQPTRKPNVAIMWAGILIAVAGTAWWSDHSGDARPMIAIGLMGLFALGWFTWVATREQRRQRELIDRLLAAMDQTESGLLIVDLEGMIQHANRALCVQIGYPCEELVGRDWRNFRVPESEEPSLAKVVATIRAGKTWEGEWLHRRKDGSAYPVHGVVTPMKNEDGRIACFITRFDDVSEARRREAELREARDAALAGDRAKGQFLATMSHEVRTPLNGIVGFTSLLLETSLSAEQREYVQTIRMSTEALIQLTGDILDFARIESGKLKLDPVACDPRECVEDALELLAGKAAGKRLELLHRVADDVPAAVVIDAGRVRQVLVNLAGNGVKFTDKGVVEIRVSLVPNANVAPSSAGEPSSDTPSQSADACTLLFAVRDTGIGIAPENHAKLFRPFSQLDESTTRRYGGTGLGLAISHNLVELMGGSISVESSPGRGSTFSFTVRAVAVAPAPQSPDLRGMRIHVAVAAEALQRELTELLATWKADVVAATKVAPQNAPPWDLSLVEVTADSAAKIVSQPPALPPETTIGLVPLSLPNEVRSALRTHFRLLVNKPVRHDALLALLTGSRGHVTAHATLTQFGFRVLMVEDNVVNQRVIEQMLTNLGCTPTIAAQGREALAHLTHDATEFDIVLLDLHMPEMDGMTVLREIRAGNVRPELRSMWVIALTADAREQQRTRALEAGLNDYLTKPLNILQLEAALKRFRDAAAAKSS